MADAARHHRVQHRMSSQDVATLEPNATVPTHRRTGKPLKVTGKVSALLDMMIETGKRYPEAAPLVGMHVRAARKALDQQHVLNELRRRKQVFRASISSGNILRLAELRDQDDNKMAAIGAIKVLEQIDDDPASNATRNHAPGVVIVIGSGASVTAPQRSIDAKPLNINDAGREPELIEPEE
jgi:hypothetical protein